ncbi:glucose-6-phosphate isomerase [Zobellia galactanivorans]|uniref:Glucose-6-phosphate isomerase n=1 Tax=Zobellia galactanivorans (strain DSM 12802 / CCUG 47099 / CIP 106680 / NCIMB 13871 / Dsij) TaxID=63186 RepID=G0LAQ6_ZOBGA|nr:glucose-6-phosphate isomerase [Zobellia galactanivorans]MBU3028042.1 glucose-6-phosphate isomerase [Zobellia galactanivorans]CAZ95494.1 Glucose-6-phosphate isomerase [Zobellia galactanivorans]
MSLQSTNPTETPIWEKLTQHYTNSQAEKVKDLFASDPSRAEKFTLKWNDFLVDFSKNRITEETMELLLQLAEEVNLAEAIKKQFDGDLINQTEGRAVLHTALRAKKSDTILVDGKNVVEEVYQVKEHIKAFTDNVISGTATGYTGKAFTDVVNIGIGGSDLGPAMVVEALKFYKNHLKLHFVSNVDGDHVNEVLKDLDPETTLFVVVSKTFTTQETLSNATTIKKWFLKHGRQEDIAKHFAAVSTNTEAIAEFGIAAENVFPMWDWVGGRFSLWSAVGLSIALAVGFDHFDELLSGANEMDEHFKNTDFKDNIPVVLALLSVWYNNFYGAETEAIIPYAQYLSRFSAYLQQGIMESNGKSVDRNGKRVGYETGTIIWGEPGTNSQHAFFQLIHQGTKIIPVDFIGYKKSLHGDVDHHNKLMANFFAQTEALMNGKTEEQVREELESKGMSENEMEKLSPFKVFEGNKPTNTILIDQLTPKSLGSLIALYEHKIFVQGVIWNIFSYDQWGVELGKQLAGTILKDIQGSEIADHDGSTLQLLRYFKS